MSKKLLAMFIFLFAFNCYADDTKVRKRFGDWILTIAQDKLTDEVKYFLATEELNNEDSPFNKKYYTFACAKSGLIEMVFIRNLITLEGTKVKLDLRADKEKPFQKDTVTSGDSLINEYVTEQDIEQLKGREKLFIRANVSSGTINMDFSLKGFDKAIQPLLDACNKQ
jgi:DNA-binding LytR/AlgR family response regulator